MKIKQTSKKFVFHICLESQRLWIYKKSVDTLLGGNSNGNIFVGRGKFSWQKSDEAFGNFFPDEIFYSYVLYTIYKYNMCHIKLKTEAGIKSFLIGKFFGISGMPDR